MAQTLKKFDLVVFGASGFTGQFVVEEVARMAEKEDLTWAVAGRKLHKIKNILEKSGKRLGKDLDWTSVILADVNSEASVSEMCAQTRVLINCVGPYNLYGDAVIRSCINHKTDYVDICGETYFLEKSQVLYNQQAQEAGVYIIGGCGFDCIPAEMGVNFTQKHFKGDLVEVENYIQFNHTGGGITLHKASLESFLIDLSYVWERMKVKAKLFPQPIPQTKYHNNRLPIFYDQQKKCWCLSMLNADVSSVERSQKHLYETEQKRPVAFKAFLCRSNFLWIIGILGFGMLWGMFGLFSLGRRFLCKFPRIFTAGFFSDQGPSMKQIDGTTFTMTFEGRGHSSLTDDPNVFPDVKPDRIIVTRITGPEMGYVTTPICLVEAAITILKERGSMPDSGGVISPGAAFSHTSLIDRLTSRGLKFSVLHTSDI